MDKRENRLTAWLEKLQQESWQLELLISGFLLSLLLSAHEELKIYLSTNTEYIQGSLEGGVFYFLVGILFSTTYILIINLIVHVVLRSLWIGAIGLRNISGEISVENLELSDRFKSYFDKKLPSFDEFIEKLENICCLIFAFTFIIIFSIFSFFIVIAFGAFFLKFLKGIGTEFHYLKQITKITALFFSLFYCIGGLLYAIDFISLGKIKKIKRISRFYFPIYAFFSAITLAKIYRPLYYNMIDNKLGRKVMLFIIPYLLLLTLSSSLDYNAYGHFPKNDSFSTINGFNYESTITNDNKYTAYEVLLSQKYYDKEDFMEVFIPYATFPPMMKLKSCFSGLQKYETGFLFGRDFKVGFESGLNPIKLNIDSSFNHKRREENLLIDCLSSHISFKIADTLQTQITYHVYKHPISKSNGILATIDILALQRGRHYLEINIKDSSDVVLKKLSIPFWKK
jgi:hypothetical protein